MWVVGSFAFLVPVIPIAVECLTHRTISPQVQRLKKRKAILAGYWQRAMATLGLSSQNADVLSFLALFLAAGLAFSAVLAVSGSDEDELALRAKEKTDVLALMVYTSGDDLTVGANEISVLVQDGSGSPVLDAQVEVSATREGAAPGSEIRGSAGDADNKLLKSVAVEVPAAGSWLVHVGVNQGGQSAAVTLPAQVVVHTPGLDDWWSYLVFPGVAICLLLVYLRRARRRCTVREYEIQAAAL